MKLIRGAAMVTFKTFGHFLWLVRKTWITRGPRLYYSQFGEDAVLREIISPQCNKGIYVDVGAYHPVKFSNTHALYKRGWRGINIDMDPVKIEAFSLARSDDVNVCAAISSEKQLKEVYNFSNYGLTSTLDPVVAAAELQKPVSIRTVETTTLNDVLEHSRYAGQEIDLLSIDVEGHDYEVLRSIDIDRYKPKIIIVESTLGSIREVIDSAIFRYLEERNYRLVSWTYLSLIFKVERSQIFRY
ncbi:FkbM family methyltransferase [Paraburkholderia sp. MMS20-SJTN17]|uniref:FkbM family methyltransferase n=1 Tax=Paraburkholderia translucens TaxID=2886945 RepID=A0ABS8K7V6_9BURK|nr:FkbM family methyltransferase [Paraburkholderia sp. MMS20-SJTN17]MCC8400583.1 FkbM family methyltransferase [Paraburkholderia sp. MMS20-SJTN17]